MKRKDRGTHVCNLISSVTGSGVAMFANKHPHVYATTCLTPDDAINSRSINSCNVLTLSGLATSPSDAIKIIDAWLNTPFKAPCPASGGQPWGEDIQTFLQAAPPEMAKIGQNQTAQIDGSTCAICSLRKGMDFQPVDIMPGGHMKIVRETPTSAYVKYIPFPSLI